ncbi:hypothetical protein CAUPRSCDRAFT_10985 [Caulochytrium protostelioides]|nr:hypothetical protein CAUPRSCDRAFT_10985 [Caulochytrium protostelioides]
MHDLRGPPSRGASSGAPPALHTDGVIDLPDPSVLQNLGPGGRLDPEWVVVPSDSDAEAGGPEADGPEVDSDGGEEASHQGAFGDEGEPSSYDGGSDDDGLEAGEGMYVQMDVHLGVMDPPTASDPMMPSNPNESAKPLVEEL